MPSERSKKLYKVSGVGLRTYVDNRCSNSTNYGSWLRVKGSRFRG